MSPWLPTIGLEVHVQLGTRSKLFCGCATTFGAPPNTQVCPVCAGLPGALPVPNREAVALGIRTGLALGCRIAAVTRFDRKHYFYPDLPKGYQISQYQQPLCAEGALEVDLPAGGTQVVRITRAHLEEDAGKSLHDQPPAESCVDLNRCGVPLIEIVSEPDLASPDAAHATLTELRRTLVAAGVSECDMEKGSLRCDANVSLRRDVAAPLGTKVEVKNLNSFRHVKHALAHEITRQAAVLDAGGRLARETRLFDPDAGETRPMRSKEEAHDYRYVPDPDLPALAIPASWVAEIRASLPESPRARRTRFVSDFGLRPTVAAVLTEEPEIAEFFEVNARALGDAELAANWVMGEVLALAKGRGGLGKLVLTSAQFVDLVRRVKRGEISAAQGKAVLAEVAVSGGAVADLIAARGLAQQNDAAAVEPIVAAVLAAHAGSVADFRAGKEQKAISFLMGKVMAASRGTANPGVARATLERLLRGRP